MITVVAFVKFIPNLYEELDKSVAEFGTHLNRQPLSKSKILCMLFRYHPLISLIVRR
jgi:hypothetical protein